jgi:4-amino-4-deoxychorismate lyase
VENALHEIAPVDLKVIETLGFTPKTGFARLGLHLDRCEGTCAALLFPFDREAVLQALGEAVVDSSVRLRLTLDQMGNVDIKTTEFSNDPGLWCVGVSDMRVASDDPWLAVKTTERGLYDQTRAAMPEGVDEVIFLNESGEVCEGTISNIFVEREGYLVTPPVACGLLPGVLRQDFLKGGEAVEGLLDLGDLEGGFYIGNSLRGLIKARLG